MLAKLLIVAFAITFCCICTGCTAEISAAAAAAASPKLSDDEQAKLDQTMQRIENASDDDMEKVLKQMATGGSDALKQAVDGIIKTTNEGYEFFKKVVDEASTHLSPKLSQEEFDKKLAAIESNPDVEEELKSANLDKRIFDFQSFADNFFELDKNNDGFVSLEELSTEKAKKADINGDGKLSPYEYVCMG
uniref:EF-hand domain-containing protein n=1 Tax=Globodera rostochiensis TaxID=31243 RepID=A0A914IFA8_GLORO